MMNDRRERIKFLSQIEDGWLDGIGGYAPSEKAVESSYALLDALEESGVSADEIFIYPSVDVEGIVFEIGLGVFGPHVDVLEDGSFIFDILDDSDTETTLTDSAESVAQRVGQWYDYER